MGAFAAPWTMGRMVGMDEQNEKGVIMDARKMKRAIDAVFDALGAEELNIAECICVARSVDGTLRDNYPLAYRLISEKKGEQR